MNYQEVIAKLNGTIPYFKTIIAVVITLVIFNIIMGFVKRAILKRARTKAQISNVKIFSRIITYVFYLIVILAVIFSKAGSWTGFGLGLGLFSAALGWALQRPITGMAAWIMVVVKRPFEIGDRVIIGSIKGDVSDVTLTHIYLKEVGGIVGGEENSGRVVLIPNASLFDQNIVNYTLRGEDTLDQVVLSITYESNLDKAMEIMEEVANKELKPYLKDAPKKPWILTYFQPSGINVHVRYFAPAKMVQEISSSITKEVFDNVSKAKDVEIAYPHTEVVLRNKKEK